MYGNPGTQSCHTALATTGAIGLAYYVLGAGVLILAGIALLTIFAILRRRRLTRD